MSNRNDDIKQLFAHLGLNEEDYQELRRKSGGTEAERATQAGSTRGKTAATTPQPKPAAPSGSRFDARAQPKVFLPGLTSEEGRPEQIPEPSAPARRADAETARLEPRLMAKPSPEAARAPVIDMPIAATAAAGQRWPLLETASRASTPVALVRRRRPPSVVGSDAGSTTRVWRGLTAREMSAIKEEVAPMPAPEMPSAADTAKDSEATSLQRVLGRIAAPKTTMTDRERPPQLRYAPRPAVQDDTPSTPGSSDLGVVLGRLGRVRR